MSSQGAMPPNMQGSGNYPPPPNLPGGSTNYPPPGTPAPKSGGLLTQRNIIIGVVVLVLLCCCCGIFGFAAYQFYNSTTAAITSQFGTLVPEQGKVVLVASDFMTNLKNSNWAGAYADCTPELQKTLVSASALGKTITDGKAQPSSWAFNYVSPLNPSDTNAEIDGSVVLTGNVQGTLSLGLQRSPSGWQINNFTLKPR